MNSDFDMKILMDAETSRKALNDLMDAFDARIVHLAEHECQNTVLEIPEMELEGVLDS